jgi:prepilin-type N-terminal cleavage/methylation domain-containing protein
MTLIELLVVLAIMGLLAVAVAPVLVGNKDKRAIQRAADAAESQISHVVSKAIGSPTGAALWMETESSGAGAGFAVVDLGFARVPLSATGSVQIGAPTSSSPAAGFTATLTPSLLSGISADLPAPIEFASVPGLFTATTISTITSGTSPTSGAVNRNSRNSPISTSGTTRVPYALHLPPRPATAGGGETLADGICVDLSESSIGIRGVSATVTSLSGKLRVAICFDRTGRPDCVWTSTSSSGGGWSRTVLTAATPVLLLVGPRSQIGATWVSNPTDDDPGLVLQNPYARWILVDPKTGGARVVEVGSSKGRSDLTSARSAALAAAVETFTNISNQ